MGGSRLLIGAAVALDECAADGSNARGSPCPGRATNYHSIVDEQFANTANTRTIPKWDKTNARITGRKGQWRVALYSTNLTNEEIIRNLEGASTYYWHAPRQIGIEVGYSMH